MISNNKSSLNYTVRSYKSSSIFVFRPHARKMMRCILEEREKSDRAFKTSPYIIEKPYITLFSSGNTYSNYPVFVMKVRSSIRAFCKFCYIVRRGPHRFD